MLTVLTGANGEVSAEVQETEFRKPGLLKLKLYSGIDNSAWLNLYRQAGRAPELKLTPERQITLAYILTLTS